VKSSTFCLVCDMWCSSALMWSLCVLMSFSNLVYISLLMRTRESSSASFRG